MFEIPDWAGMMDWDHIRELNTKGHEIGSHTRSHPILTNINNRSEIINEIQTSRTIIEEHISKDVTSFCYPNGDHNEDVQSIVSDSGYSNAVITEIGINESNASLMRIKRVDIDPVRIISRKQQLSNYALHFRLSCVNPLT